MFVTYSSWSDVRKEAKAKIKKSAAQTVARICDNRLHIWAAIQNSKRACKNAYGISQLRHDNAIPNALQNAKLSLERIQYCLTYS